MNRSTGLRAYRACVAIVVFISLPVLAQSGTQDAPVTNNPTIGNGGKAGAAEGAIIRAPAGSKSMAPEDVYPRSAAAFSAARTDALFTQLDTNHDGFISRRESKASSLSVKFKLIDTNHDGKISREELSGFSNRP